MIKVTDLACETIRKTFFSENKNDHVARLRIITGGCSGHDYKFDLDGRVEADDIRAETDGTVIVVIDLESMKFVDGIVIDYLKTPLGGQFTFKNPNATGGCGCAKSFSVEARADEAMA